MRIIRALGLSSSRRVSGPPGYWKPDAATVERIRAAYLRTLDQHQAESSPLWGIIVEEKRKDIHDALVSGGETLRSMLADPTSTNLYFGVDNLAVDILRSGNVPGQDWLSAHCLASLAQLAVMVGADRMTNPEGGALGSQPPNRSLDEILTMLDAAFPATVDFPNPFRGEIFAAETPRGFIGNRAVHALYQARRLMQANPPGRARCLEIGAGTGRTAYYAVKWGIPSYTIVDLPITAVGQACFLMATLGPDKVSLYGEDGRAPVRLLPPHWLFETSEQFDVALNCDSFTEMSREYAERYIAFIRANCRAFISINHEANQFTVRQLWPGLMRFPYALRAGYLEEFTAPAGRHGEGP